MDSNAVSVSILAIFLFAACESCDSRQGLIDVSQFDPDTALFDGQPVRVQLRRLVSGSEDERFSAVEALLNIYCGHPGPTTSGPHDLDRKTRQRMISEVNWGRISGRARVVVPALRAALDDGSKLVREGAVQALRAIGPEAAGACDKLREKLKHQDPVFRTLCARALHAIRLEVEVPLATQLELLEHEDPDVRSFACFSLALMEEDAKPAIPALERKLTDPVEDVRTQARQALRWIR